VVVVAWKEERSEKVGQETVFCMVCGNKGTRVIIGVSVGCQLGLRLDVVSEPRGILNRCLCHGMAWTVGKILHMGALGGVGEAGTEAVCAGQRYFKEEIVQRKCIHCDTRCGSVLLSVANMSLDSRSACGGGRFVFCSWKRL